MTRGRQLTVRGIATDMMTWLQQVAEQERRSLDKQILYILERYRAQHAERSYATAQGERLNAALAAITALPPFSTLNATVVAEKAQVADATAVLRAFSGEVALPFELGDRVASVLTVSPDWLKHGTGTPYPCAYWRLDGGEIGEVTARLASYRADHGTVRFLRDDSPTGNLYILCTFDGSPRFELYHTPHHISEHVGGGGAAAIRRFFRILKDASHSQGKIYFTSHIIAAGQLRNVIENESGMKHPLSLTWNRTDNHWADDVWDRAMLDNGIEHWPGQKAFSRRFIPEAEAEEARWAEWQAKLAQSSTSAQPEAGAGV